MIPELPDLGVLKDISESGIGLEHNRPIPIGKIVACRVLDAPIDIPCEYRVEILWQKTRADGTYLSGGRILASEH